MNTKNTMQIKRWEREGGREGERERERERERQLTVPCTTGYILLDHEWNAVSMIQ